MEDHDQRFKTLLKEFLAEFFVLFFPDWARRLDFSQIEWLPLELFRDPPSGAKVEMDLAAKVATREPIEPLRHGEVESCVVIVHIEVEWPDRVVSFRHRMVDFYRELRRQYNIPVLPITLFLRVGLEGIGWDVYEETFWDHTFLRFEYAYIGLPALDAQPYLEGPIILGVALAALMRLPPERRAELKAQAMQRIKREAPEQGRDFLADCIEAYFPLNETESGVYDQLIQEDRYREAREMTTIFDERGRVRGHKEGLVEGRTMEARELLTKLLDKRFGPLSNEVQTLLLSMPLARLEEIALSLLDAASLKDLGLET